MNFVSSSDDEDANRAFIGGPYFRGNLAREIRNYVEPSAAVRRVIETREEAEDRDTEEASSSSVRHSIIRNF